MNLSRTLGTVVSMTAFDDAAWKRVLALTGEHTLALVDRNDPIETFTEIFEGWTLTYVDEGTHPGHHKQVMSGDRPKPTLTAFTRPEAAAVVLTNPFTRQVMNNGNLRWRGWAISAPHDRMARISTALHWDTLVGPDLIAVVEQMTVMARMDPTYGWAGYPEQVLPFALAQMTAEDRAAYEVLAGLGAYSS